MAYIPYGYRIRNGMAVIEPQEAENIRTFTRLYLEGQSIKNAASMASLSVSATTANHMLKNPVYLGDDYYPAILERDVFDQLAQEREKRYGRMGRHRTSEQTPEVPARFTFRMIPEKEGDNKESLDAIINCNTDNKGPRDITINCNTDNYGPRDITINCDTDDNGPRDISALKTDPAALAEYLYSRIIYDPFGDTALRPEDKANMSKIIKKYQPEKAGSHNRKTPA